MARRTPKAKFGLVLLLDALGAATYTPDQILQFLSARSEVNSAIRQLAKRLPPKVEIASPVIFTFGDTLLITIELKEGETIPGQLTVATLLMRRYLFHSLERHVLFRGAFSVGTYIEDSRTNTVMGEAVADAAQWYERADWMGLHATPRTCTQLEYLHQHEALAEAQYLFKYPVPLKGGGTFDLYAISWAGAFFNQSMLKASGHATSRKWFLSILKDLSYPAAAASKYENTKRFFDHVERQVLAASSGSAKAAPETGARGDASLKKHLPSS